MRIQHPLAAVIVAAVSAVVSGAGCSSAPTDEPTAREGEDLQIHFCPEILPFCAYGRTCTVQNGCPFCTCDAPPNVAPARDLALVSMSESSYARGPDGTLHAWGQNDFGQLDDGTTSNRYAPSPMQVPDATQLVAGEDFGCALRADATVSCWGYQGASTSTALQSIPGLANVTQIAAADTYACAVTGGQVWCWGTIPTFGINVAAPSQVAGLTNAVQVAAMDQTACALLTDGTVDCWGSNVYGELGNGQNSDTIVKTPAPVPSISGVTGLATGQYGICASEANGQVWCWGVISSGELLNAWPAQGSATPIHVQPLDGASALALGVTSCAVFSGSVQCWGFNRGLLGNGATAPAYSLTPIPGLSSITEIASSLDHTCARSSSGNVWCWGDDYYGQVGVGDPASDDIESPVQVL